MDCLLLDEIWIKGQQNFHLDTLTSTAPRRRWQTYSNHQTFKTRTGAAMSGRYVPPSYRESPGNATAGNSNSTSTSNALTEFKRYIPPFLRNREVNAASKEEAKTPLRSMPDTLRSAREIQQYYFPGKESPSHDVATLHDSAQTPGKLTYVLIFHGANPRWPQDRIIFSKSNLDLLPVGPADDCTPPPGSTVNDTPQKPAGDLGDASKSTLVAVFEQMTQPAQAYHSSAFEFTGYYRIAKVAFLEPRSPDLLRNAGAKILAYRSMGSDASKRTQQGKVGGEPQ